MLACLLSHTETSIVSALFRTSLTCAPEEIVEEPEIEAEPLSPRRAAAAAAFESTPFARVVVDPPVLVLVLNGMPFPAAVAEVSNTGGMAGEYHVCKDSLPGWMSLDGNGRGELGPGQKTELGIVVDAAAADAAAGSELNGSELAQHRPAACAVLRLEVEGGGSGTLLAVVCMVADR